MLVPKVSESRFRKPPAKKWLSMAAEDGSIRACLNACAARKSSMTTRAASPPAASRHVDGYSTVAAQHDHVT